jgi:hypothetical protein
VAKDAAKSAPAATEAEAAPESSGSAVATAEDAPELPGSGETPADDTAADESGEG